MPLDPPVRPAPEEILNAEDLERVLRLTEKAHRSLGFREIQKEFLHDLRGIIDFDSAFASILNLRTGQLSVAFVEGPSEWLKPYARFMGEDPIIRCFRKRGEGGVVRGSDVMPPSELRKTRFYREYLAPYGIGWALVAGMIVLPGIGCGFSLRRKLGREDFSDRDKAVLIALKPHIETALRNAITYEQMKGSAEILTALFHQEDKGLVVAHPDGTIRLLNPTAASFLGPLSPDPRNEPLLRLPKAIVRHLQRHPTEPLTFQAKPESGPPLCLKARPQESADDEAVWLIEIRKDAEAVSREAFRRLGLSRREVEVAELVCLGRSNREIAMVLAISEETVKVHLKRIFRKLGIRTRTALMARWGEAGRE